MSIDGLASGLDTTSIVNSLMQIERQPGVLMQSRQTSIKAAVDAFTSVAAKMTALGNAAAALQRNSGWGARTATSSDPTLATINASDNAPLSSLTFTVDAVAKAHGVAAAADVAQTTSAVASGGSLTLTVGADAHVISVGTGTLAEVVDAVNNARLGVRAAAVNTGTGYRLQFSASATGAASTFTVDGLDPVLGGTVVTAVGADARITIGEGAGAYAVTSPSNSFADVLPGVTVRAVSASVNPVTVTVDGNADALADKVSALVDAANAALAEIAAKSAYDTKTNKGGPLTGDSTVTRLRQEIVRSMVDGLAQSPLTPGGAGISVDRSGKITFNRDTFKAAFAADPDSVRRVFAQGATTTGGAEFVAAGDRTKAGVYAVDVTTAPGVGIDAAGTIDGLPAVGNGSLLTVLATTPGAASGVSVRLTGAGTGAVGSISYEPGLAQRISTLVSVATSSTDGSLTSSKAAQQANVDALQRSIDSFENRMTKREAALKKEYAALEVALGNLKNQGNWLSGQLSSLSANSGG